MRPRCTDCKEYYYFDLESNRYNCPCPHSIKASDIQFHHANMNRHYKSLEERAAEFKRQRAEQFQTSTNYNNNPFTNRSRITTERGATNKSTGVPPGGSFDDSNHSVFQSFDPRENYIRQSMGYSERSRTQGKTISTQELHPLDRSLHNEYPFMQIREVKELPRAAPTDKAIVQKNTRDKVRSYPSYFEDSSNDKDPYDNV